MCKSYISQLIALYYMIKYSSNKNGRSTGSLVEQKRAYKTAVYKKQYFNDLHFTNQSIRDIQHYC